jgi:diacylglycerol kinase family enzyme
VVALVPLEACVAEPSFDRVALFVGDTHAEVIAGAAPLVKRKAGVAEVRHHRVALSLDDARAENPFVEVDGRIGSSVSKAAWSSRGMLATMKRAALIVNPFASGVTEERLAVVERELRADVELTVTLTERPEHATELARRVEDADRVYVFGGDGLLNEVLNGLPQGAVVGIVPGGRTNVVGRALGVPLDPAAAARALLSARPRRISLGRADGRRFTFAAGLGFAAELVRRVDRLGRRNDGRRPGDLVFTWEAAKLLAAQRGRYEPALEIEGFGRAAFALVANGYPYSYVGSRPLRVTPEARFELGLDLVAPQRLAPGAIPRFVSYAFRGGGERAEDVFYGHDLDRIEVHCDRPLPLQLDGEDLGDVNSVVFVAERDAVSILAPDVGTLTE